VKLNLDYRKPANPDNHKEVLDVEFGNVRVTALVRPDDTVNASTMLHDPAHVSSFHVPTIRANDNISVGFTTANPNGNSFHVGVLLTEQQAAHLVEQLQQALTERAAADLTDKVW